MQVAIKQLKAAKSDCTDHLVLDYFINGTEKLFSLISLLFTYMLSHGVSPLGLLCSTIVPVSKDKRGSKSDSNIYRAMAIKSILEKLFDSIIIKEKYFSLIIEIYNLFLKKILQLLFVLNY